MTSNLPANAKHKDFLAKIKKSNKKVVNRSKLAKAVEKTPKLLFSMDATASRQHTWEVAQDITVSMFDVLPGGLKIALAYHGGGSLREVSNFRDNASYFKDKVKGVRCMAGHTALCEILEEAVEINGLSALIYIGDCFEEGKHKAESLARKLKVKKVPCFMFIEGDDPEAQKAFAMIAEITGGALFPFEMAATIRVKEKLEAIAAYAAGGMKLLRERQGSLPGAKDLIAKLGPG